VRCDYCQPRGEYSLEEGASSFGRAVRYVAGQVRAGGVFKINGKKGKTRDASEINHESCPAEKTKFFSGGTSSWGRGAV